MRYLYHSPVSDYKTTRWICPLSPKTRDHWVNVDEQITIDPMKWIKGVVQRGFGPNLIAILALYDLEVD